MSLRTILKEEYKNPKMQYMKESDTQIFALQGVVIMKNYGCLSMFIYYKQYVSSITLGVRKDFGNKVLSYKSNKRKKHYCQNVSIRFDYYIQVLIFHYLVLGLRSD